MVGDRAGWLVESGGQSDRDRVLRVSSLVPRPSISIAGNGSGDPSADLGVSEPHRPREKLWWGLRIGRLVGYSR